LVAMYIVGASEPMSLSNKLLAVSLRWAG
jgi:hypothetical protein